MQGFGRNEFNSNHPERFIRKNYVIPFIPEEKLLPALLKSYDNMKPVTTI